MDVSQLQILNEGLGPQSTVDYKFETILDLANSFSTESNEDIKKCIRDSLIDEFNFLIFELEARLKSLKSRLETI